MDTFYARPVSSTYSPLSSLSPVTVHSTITPLGPILPLRNPTIPLVTTSTITPIIPRVGIVTSAGLTTVYNPNSMYYYDSGIGENPLAQHETNTSLRYKFLDKWLYEYSDILSMLRVDGKTVSVLSKSEAEKNDISKDTISVLEAKSDFIGMEILTLHKNKKILDTLCMKNNIRYYDLPHNESYVRKSQHRYVLSKLEEMQK